MVPMTYGQVRLPLFPAIPGELLSTRVFLIVATCAPPGIPARLCIRPRVVTLCHSMGTTCRASMNRGKEAFRDDGESADGSGGGCGWLTRTVRGTRGLCGLPTTTHVLIRRDGRGGPPDVPKGNGRDPLGVRGGRRQDVTASARERYQLSVLCKQLVKLGHTVFHASARMIERQG